MEGDKVVQARKEPTVFFPLISISTCLLELSLADTLRRDIRQLSANLETSPPCLGSSVLPSPMKTDT